MLAYLTQLNAGTLTVRAYVYAAEVNGATSFAVSVPSVVDVPLNVSVTVIVLFTDVVGAVNAPPAVPLAVPSGVDAAVLSHVAVAVFVNAAGDGADA